MLSAVLLAIVRTSYAKEMNAVLTVGDVGKYTLDVGSGDISSAKTADEVAALYGEPCFFQSRIYIGINRALIAEADVLFENSIRLDIAQSVGNFLIRERREAEPVI